MLVGLNVALLIFGLFGTLAAFGGDTWEKGNTFWLKRVTKRGWISLFALVVAFVLGVAKEVISSRQEESTKQAAATEMADLKSQLAVALQTSARRAAELAETQKRLGTLQSELQSSQKEIGRTIDNVSHNVDQINNDTLERLEDGFKLTAKIIRESDDGVFHLMGEARTHLPSRIGPQLELYWGDDLEVTIFSDHPNDLGGLALAVGDKTYPLSGDGNRLLFEQRIRIYGTSPAPMVAELINPNHASDVIVKYFVRSTDTTRAQREFKEMVLNSNLLPVAKAQYKTTNVDAARIHAEPNERSPIRTQLPKGSFVRIIQTLADWSEVSLPTNTTGWIKATMLSELH